jgi:hypothetical protein
MKISLEIHSGDVNNDSGLGDFSIHYFPESLIHISPESLFTISRNDYSHAPEYAPASPHSWRSGSRRSQTTKISASVTASRAEISSA